MFAVRFFHQGQTIFKEGSLANEAYLIKTGKVGISKTVDHRVVELAQLKPSDIFGEMGLISPNRKRTAKAEALEGTELVIIEKVVFDKHMTSASQITKSILNAMVNRLEKTTTMKNFSRQESPLQSYFHLLQMQSKIYGDCIPYANALKDFQKVLGLEKIETEKVLHKLYILNLISMAPNESKPKSLSVVKTPNVEKKLKDLNSQLGEEYFDYRLSSKEFFDIEESAQKLDLPVEKLKAAVNSAGIPTKAIFLHLETLHENLDVIRNQKRKSFEKSIEDFTEINDFAVLSKEDLSNCFSQFQINKWILLLTKADEPLMGKIQNILSDKMFIRLQNDIQSIPSYDEGEYESYFEELLDIAKNIRNN